MIPRIRVIIMADSSLDTQEIAFVDDDTPSEDFVRPGFEIIEEFEFSTTDEFPAMFPMCENLRTMR